MSRSNLAKSRADKSSSKLALAASTPVTHDIIPGKFTDHDWTFMLDRDDADDFVAEVLDEWYAEVDRVIHENYIQRQLVPYTVLQAKDAILQIIEWQFLARDNGDPTDCTHGGWIQDCEPAAAATDCWAQGAVPKMVSGQCLSFRPSLATIGGGDAGESAPDVCSDSSSDLLCKQHEDDSAATGATCVSNSGDADDGNNFQQSAVITDVESVQPGCHPAGGGPDNAAIDSGEALEAAGDEQRHEAEQQTTDELPQEQSVSGVAVGAPVSSSKDRDVVKLYRKRSVPKTAYADGCVTETLPSQQAVSLNQNDCLKLMKSTRVGEFNMKKISPRRLPSNMVNTVFCLIDPCTQEVEERRKALRNGRRPPGSTRNPCTSDGRMMPGGLSSRDHFTEMPSTFHPMMIDTMDLAAGVAISDDQCRVKKGPKQRAVTETDLLCSALRCGLQPVRTQHQKQSLSAADLLDSCVPIIRPLAEAPPIPPINKQMAST